MNQFYPLRRVKTNCLLILPQKSQKVKFFNIAVNCPLYDDISKY